MSSPTSRVIGTLVVVVLKANHLPNKRHIGKQDPYCVVSVNGDKRRTKAIKRGGQHPEWDEEIRFEIQEAAQVETADENGTPPPLPPKSGRSMKNIQVEGGKTMKIACYADDIREPDFIGEADVDLTEVLTKGECDEWFTLMNKDKFAGKVYLELTFWSNEPAPEKKANPKAVTSKNDGQYGGPGSFIASPDLPPSLRTAQQSRIASTSVVYDHLRRQSDSMPSSMKTSASLAQLDLYSPPYERGNQSSTVENITNGFSELGVIEHRRRESFPPPVGGFIGRAPSASYSTISSHISQVYEPPITDATNTYPYERPITPNGQMGMHHRESMSGSYHIPYQPQYESPPPTSYNPPPPPPPPVRGPRYSIPSTSSGFVSISNGTSSSFAPTPAHSSESSTFSPPPLSHTPVPSVYSHFNHPANIPPPPSHTPMSSHPSASSFTRPPPFPPQHSLTYPPYASRPLPQPQVYSSQHPTYTPAPPVQHDYNGQYSPLPNSSSQFTSPESTGFQPLPIPPLPPTDYQQNTTAPADYQPPVHPVYPGPPPPPPAVPQAPLQPGWA